LWGSFDRQRHFLLLQPLESDVVHDYVRLRQYQMVAIACIVVAVGARHMKHAGTTQAGETVGGSSGSGQLSPGRGSTEMISDGCMDADRKVLVKCVGENLLPTAQARRLYRLSFRCSDTARPLLDRSSRRDRWRARPSFTQSAASCRTHCSVTASRSVSSAVVISLSDNPEASAATGRSAQSWRIWPSRAAVH
jgi:hypothetical protein